ncbi:MAG TPA: TetR/AcrR family transcriptional regulator [Polyangiaceae bacterium]|jgi:AcrR family transcriptional regulator
MARPRTDIQPRIVRAARARFLAEGVDGASLRTIAADAGTNIGMVFYYFPTKDDLFLAVVEEIYARLLDDLAKALAGDAPLGDRLQRAFVRLGKASDEELAVVRLVVREVLLSSERFARVFARMQRGHLALLLATLAEGVQSGALDADIPPPLLLLATFAMGALPQLARRAAGDRPPFSMLPGPEKLAEASVELLLRAIGAAPPKPPSRIRGDASPRTTGGAGSRAGPDRTATRRRRRP